MLQKMPIKKSNAHMIQPPFQPIHEVPLPLILQSFHRPLCRDCTGVKTHCTMLNTWLCEQDKAVVKEGPAETHPQAISETNEDFVHPVKC